MRKVSGLINGTGRDMIIPVPVYACANCGHVNEMFAKNTGLPSETPEEATPPVTEKESNSAIL